MMNPPILTYLLGWTINLFPDSDFFHLAVSGKVHSTGISDLKLVLNGSGLSAVTY